MPSTDTITSFYSFTAQTVIQSAQMNTNFSNFRGHMIPITTDTATASNNTYDLGSSTYKWRNGYFGGSLTTEGVKFKASGTGSDTISWNEQSATWSITHTFAGGNGTSALSPAVCRVTRRGNDVFLRGYVLLTKGTGSGALTFSLPYAGSSISNFYQKINIFAFGAITYPANRNAITGYILSNSTMNVFFNSANGGSSTAVTAADLGTTCEFIFEGVYQTG